MFSNFIFEIVRAEDIKLSYKQHTLQRGGGLTANKLEEDTKVSIFLHLYIDDYFSSHAIW